MLKNNFTSSPYPLIVFGRDVFVLVKAKNVFFGLYTSLYSTRHLQYRGSERTIPLHALQTTVKGFLWLIVCLAHPFHAPFMQFQNQF